MAVAMTSGALPDSSIAAVPADVKESNCLFLFEITSGV
jgi:hypothetical protein